MPQSHALLKSFFGFTDIPFTSEVKPGKYFTYPQFEEALSLMRYVADRKGTATLTAPPGSGKSTLIRAFIDDLGQTQFLPVYVPEATCSTVELYKAIAFAFGIQPAHFKVLIIRQIKERLLNLSQNRNITPVLVLDEAHLLHRPFFDELRILSNFDADCSNHLALIMAGQPTLDSSLNLSINESLAQRLIARIRLPGFDRSLAEAYIQHRLKLVGRTAPIFLPDATEAIIVYANGAARPIDRLAEKAIYIAFSRKHKEVTLDDVNHAIAELAK